MHLGLFRILVVTAMLLMPQLAAFQQVKLRGTVRDGASRKPIPRATVTATGNQSRQNEVTDDQGIFSLVLVGVSPGALVRIRVEKEGYAPFDRQIAVSEEIPIEIAMSVMPARSRTNTAGVSPIEAHFIEQLKSKDTEKRFSAIESLSKQSPVSAAATAAITAAVLDPDIGVQVEAVRVVLRLKTGSAKAVQNLIIALSDSHDTESGGILRELAAKALGEIGPNAKSAIPALLSTLQSPYASNERKEAALALVRLGVRDPRLDATLIKHTASGYDADTTEALVKMGSSAARLIPGLIDALRAKLRDHGGPQGSQAHLDIIRVLEATAPAGEAALSQMMVSLAPIDQARLALAWVEMKPTAQFEILRTVKIDEVRASLVKLSSEGPADLSLSGRLIARDLQGGALLRAAMGVLLLDLDPQESAWQVLLEALAIKKSDFFWTYRIAYAGFYIAQFAPAKGRRALPALVEALGQCGEECTKNAESVPALAVLVTAIEQLGDTTTIPLLDPIARDSKWEPTRQAARQAIEAIQHRAQMR